MPAEREAGTLSAVDASSPAKAPGVSTPSIASVEPDERGVTIVWSDGGRGRYLHFWLRENCPADGSSLSGQRLLALADIPVDIRPKSVAARGDTVTLVWSDGHRSTFDGAWLRERSHESGAKPPPLDIATWDASLDPEDLVVGFASAIDADRVPGAGGRVHHLRQSPHRGLSPGGAFQSSSIRLKATIARPIAVNHSSERAIASAILGFLPPTTTHHVQ